MVLGVGYIKKRGCGISEKKKGKVNDENRRIWNNGLK